MRPNLDGWLTPWSTRVGRVPFFLAGLVLMTLKYAIDRRVASAFGSDWMPWCYWDPGVSALAETWFARDGLLFESLLLVAAPFVLIGLALTCARLNDAGLPRGLVVLFFIPWINGLLFMVLALVPDRDRRATPQRSAWLGRVAPRGPIGSALAAVGILVPLIAAAFIVVRPLEHPYGLGLFVGIPFALGCLAAYLFGYRQSRQRAGALLVASLACLIAASALLVFAYEGLVCLLMAAPLAIPLALAGGYLGWALAELRHTASASEAPALSMTVLLSLGLLLEGRGTLVEPVREVLTAVEIGAPCETVWEHVVEFPPLSDPEELLFRAGIAWPASATIEGTGAGAIRRCVFSTGAFVEPISVWDAPHVLRFDVTENPPPLSELNPFGHVDAPHLHGTFQAVEGEFRLIHLPGGRTRLEGRTWYRNAMTPRWYWGAWSDAVVHRIHARVLDHVRALSESEPF